MSNFVANLEAELHRAAVKQEQAGRLRWAGLRARLALPRVAATATAVAGLALAVAVTAVLVGSEPERAPQGNVPAPLRGTWRLAAPVEFHVEPLTVDLHLYPPGSSRCATLGAGSNACYEIENAQFGALEWGRFSIASDRITFRAKLLTYCSSLPCRALGPEAAQPGVYRWRVAGGSLLLTRQRDQLNARADALGAGPLTRPALPAPRAAIPDGWTARRFTSRRYNYSIRYPRRWSALTAAGAMPKDALTAETSDTVDRFSRDPSGIGVPMLLIGAVEVPRGTSSERWTAAVGAHVERSEGCLPSARRSSTAGGEPATITVYAECHRRHIIWATFVHSGRGYQVSWWGKTERARADAPLFYELLGSFEFRG